MPGRICWIKIPNRSFEYVSQFRCLGVIVTNQNFIQKKIKRRLNSGTVCYHVALKLFVFLAAVEEGKH
jgi:hypothetical protein